MAAPKDRPKMMKAAKKRAAEALEAKATSQEKKSKQSQVN